jgi:hypothetical protein
MKTFYKPVALTLLALTALACIWIVQRCHFSEAIQKQVKTKKPVSSQQAEPVIPENMLADIRSSLEKQEYHISYDEQKKKLQSPNRRNNLRAYYEPGKLTVETRVDTTGDGFKLQLVNEGIFADGNLLYTPETGAKAELHENTVQISHQAFTEEFINNEDGVRQNFIIEKAPEGTRQLRVKMTAKGLKVEQGEGNELRFYSETPKGKTRKELVYSDLKCWDAKKKLLNATLAYVDNHIQISVDVAGAAYPVTIDPIVANGTPQNPNKVLEINQSYMWLGFSVSSAGDVNGDGYSDVIVGAPDYDKGQDNEGGAFVYKGDPSGLTLTAVTFESNQKDARMGYSVASAGDFNGDGFADLIAGARYYSKGQNHEGAAFVYHGSKTGLDPIAASTLESNQADAWLGSAVAAAGDVNGDGYSDVMVAAYAFDNGQKDEGSVFVWHGRGSGLADKLLPNIISQLHPGSYEGNQVACAGDVNGDGYSDIIVGAIRYEIYQVTGLGAAIIYYGSPDGVSSANFDVITQNQIWPYAQFGFSSSAAGDMNGDGFDDVVIGAYGYQTGGSDQGAAFIYYGGADGINTNSPAMIFDVSLGSEFGRSVSKAGDINNDGYDDVIIGAPLYQKNQASYGAAYIYFGSSNGILPQPEILEGSYTDAQFGCSVASAGDTNGDGFGDLVIGSKKFSDGESNEGAAFFYKGSGTGIKTNEVVILQGNQANAEMGSCVSAAGDVNSDGFGDIIIGAPKSGKILGGAAFIYYGSSLGIDALNRTVLESDKAGSLFGISVKSSGDVNADGYGDIIIGAQDYNFGAAFVFNGSAGGINTSTPWYCMSDMYTNYGELMGASAAGAGDVNGDGYSDVVIGSIFYDWKGASLIFYGNSRLGLENNLRLYNSDLTTPINHTQFPQPDFGAGLYAKSFLGNNKGKLVWETKPLGQGFSKGSNNLITNSVQSSGSQNLYTSLGLAGVELKSVITKQGPSTKVRTRVKYDPVLAMTGQMYGPWRYLPAYLQGNSTSPVPESATDSTAALVEQIAATKALDGSENSEIIYPNPASDQLHIRMGNPEMIQNVKLFTSTGKTAYESGKHQETIDVKGFAAGTYILWITHRDGSHTNRRVVIR